MQKFPVVRVEPQVDENPELPLAYLSICQSLGVSFLQESEIDETYFPPGSNEGWLPRIEETLPPEADKYFVWAMLQFQRDLDKRPVLYDYMYNPLITAELRKLTCFFVPNKPEYISTNYLNLATSSEILILDEVVLTNFLLTMNEKEILLQFWIPFGENKSLFFEAYSTNNGRKFVFTII